MKNLVARFVALPHRRFYETFDTSQVLQEVRHDLGDQNLKQKWIYLAHTDGIYFSLAFLEILDRGGWPIAFANSQSFHFDSWAFIDGKWDLSCMPRLGTAGNYYAVPTSGTTGKPKICEFSLESAMQLAESHADAFQLNSDFEIAQCLPVHHSYGIVAYILTSLVKGLGINFCPSMMGLRKLKKDPESRPAMLHVSPSQARFILRDKVSAENLKKFSIGGGAVSISEVENLQNLLPHADIFVSYGLTEAGPRVSTGLFTSNFKTQFHLTGEETWIGSPLKEIEVKVIESTDGIEGKLCVKTPHRKLNTDSDEVEGDWLKTRDRVKIIKNEIFFISREDDLIKFGGITIYPRDLEQLARTWPGVNDVIILKEEDPLYGDRPLLFIEGTIATTELEKYINRDFIYATAFNKYFVLEKFPRQSLEKVNRKVLLSMTREAKND